MRRRSLFILTVIGGAGRATDADSVALRNGKRTEGTLVGANSRQIDFLTSAGRVDPACLSKTLHPLLSRHPKPSRRAGGRRNSSRHVAPRPDHRRDRRRQDSGRHEVPRISRRSDPVRRLRGCLSRR